MQPYSEKLIGIAPYVLYSPLMNLKAQGVVIAFGKPIDFGNLIFNNLNKGIYDLVFTDTRVIIADANDAASKMVKSSIFDQMGDGTYGYSRMIQQIGKTRVVITDQAADQNKEVVSLPYISIKKVIIHAHARTIYFISQENALFFVAYDVISLFEKTPFNDSFLSFIKTTPFKDKIEFVYF